MDAGWKRKTRRSALYFGRLRICSAQPRKYRGMPEPKLNNSFRLIAPNRKQFYCPGDCFGLARTQPRKDWFFVSGFPFPPTGGQGAPTPPNSSHTLYFLFPKLPPLAAMDERYPPLPLIPACLFCQYFFLQRRGVDHGVCRPGAG